MNSITDGLLGQLQGQPLNQISQKLGLSSTQASAAIAAALPLLIGALGRNSRQTQGAQSLFSALQRDHADVDPQQALGNALGGGGQGQQILGHMFGAREPFAAQGLGSATGLAPDRANMLLRWLAPVAMAYLAKRMFDKRNPAADSSASPGVALPGAMPTGNGTTTGAQSPASPEVLGQVLQQEEQQISRQGGIGGRLLGAVLDRNHDGKVDFSDLLG